ncbi:MAG TPA: NAD(P)H-hydrate dehydratase [Gemmatimonadaceae bacterium]|nr:NAD(P)H-hydrate dehydratase [Gemmatimonadaceae bacterium]
MGARVASASETVECERVAIERGTSSAELMQRAGDGAAALIYEHHRDEAGNGVAIFAGPGNNGGDGWVVAESLRRRGLQCRVASTGIPRTDEARNARTNALAAGAVETGIAGGPERLLIDALLGTGSTGVPRGEIAAAVDCMRTGSGQGANIVSLDLPTGLDATTGEHDEGLTADMTISFGTMKRGHLLSRDACGEIFVVDIGLGEAPSLPLLIDADWVAARIPPIAFDAHKGTRKTLAIVGGARGMAGAAILAGEGALRSGIGLLRMVTEPGNEIAVHAGIPAAIVQQWPSAAADIAHILKGVDALALGPGLGKGATTRDMVERILLAWSGPVVLDADGLNLFAGDALSLAQLLQGRPAVITPHPAEFARLAGVDTKDVSKNRFDIGLELAAQLGAAVLLKGSPTVVFSPSGDRFVSASGTAALGTGGSGDVLTGMVGTLLAQNADGGPRNNAAEAAACAAWVHGRAAEVCHYVRGVTLTDILEAMPHAWNIQKVPTEAGVLAHLGSLS